MATAAILVLSAGLKLLEPRWQPGDCVPPFTPGLRTGLLQSHHGGLLYEVPLDEAAEVLAVGAEVGQLEGVDGHLHRDLLGALAGHVQAGQRHDGRAGVGDPPRQTLLWQGGDRQNTR